MLLLEHREVFVHATFDPKCLHIEFYDLIDLRWNKETNK